MGIHTNTEQRYKHNNAGRIMDAVPDDGCILMYVTVPVTEKLIVRYLLRPQMYPQSTLTWHNESSVSLMHEYVNEDKHLLSYLIAATSLSTLVF